MKGGVPPPHHDPGGGFRNPWPTAHTPSRAASGAGSASAAPGSSPTDPTPESLPRARPSIAYPRAGAHELRLTWVGHATFLVQIGGINLLTDPQWSRRASPFQFVGPSRFVPPGLEWESLPPIDGVLLSHDHYDHLDSGTARLMRGRFGDGVRWFTPLGYRAWLRRRGNRLLGFMCAGRMNHRGS